MNTDPVEHDTPVRHRFFAAQDSEHTNYGKFSLVAYGDEARAHVPRPMREPLLGSVKPVARLGGAIAPTSLWLLDLQTREGVMFDPCDEPATLRRRFLVHPVHVCILFYPLLCRLARAAAEIWTLPDLVTLSLADVLAQPGLLLDLHGRPVRGMREWLRRAPLAARMRNREVPPEENGQAEVTPDERAQMGLATADGRPAW